MAVISNNGVPEVRTLKPLFTKTQGTFKDFEVDPNETAIVPGMVACMGENGIKPASGKERPLGLFATYRSVDVWEIPTAGVFVFGGGAMIEVEKSVIDPEADWENAKKDLATSTVLLESNANGQLTIGEGENEAVCQLLEIRVGTIVVGGVPSGVVSSTPTPPSPEPETVEMTASVPVFSDEQFAGKNLVDLTTGLNVEQDDKTFRFTGTINHIEDWTEFSSNEEDRTGYYVPFKVESDDGAVLSNQTLTGEQKNLTFGQTGDGEGTIILIFATKQDAPTKQVTIYPNATDAESQTNGVQYTFDFSGCTFGE